VNIAVQELFLIRLGVVDQLMPHPVGILILQKGGHHGAVSLQNAGTLGVVVGQIGEQFGHAAGHHPLPRPQKKGKSGP